MMTPGARVRLGDINFLIRELEFDRRHVEDRLTEIETKIATLDAERWQIVLTE